ncbi:MAG: metallophosphoesterase [Candidatus Woesearchaeota archaeon]
MELSEGIEIIDLALYLEEYNALVIGDVHLGFEESLTKQGVLIPRFQFKDTIQRLEKILEQVTGLKEIIINGDLKHEFGSISDQEWHDALLLIDFLGKHCGKVVLVKGNHDVILAPIARKRGIEIVKDYWLGEILITHGHNVPEHAEKAKVVVIGDEHPAVSIREGARVELFKCFLRGKWHNKLLIAMPSFNMVTIGTDILKEKIQSPFLQQNLDDFEVFVVADKVYGFGKLGKLAEQ